MRQVILKGARHFINQEIQQQFTADDTVIQVKTVGICGSDLHQWHDGEEFKGLVMGHEFSGVIHSKGSSTFNIGDRVTVNPIMSCGSCYYCKNNQSNLCGDAAIGSSVEYQGAYADYVKVPTDNIIKINDTLTFEEAAFVEPAAVAYHAVKKLNVNKDDKILIAGAGIIGLLVASIVKSLGASYVAITDINAAKLDFVQKHNIANAAFNALDDDLSEQLQEASKGFTKFFDCVGIAPSINNGINSLLPLGEAALIGVNFKPVAFDTYPILVKEIKITGINCYTNSDFESALNLITEKKINVKQFITKHIQLDEIQTTFEMLSNGNNDEIKIMIHLD